MPNWSDPAEIARDGAIFQKICLVMLGVSTWEIIVQLPFDWSIISRKREVRWPSFFYFLCRYSLWFGVIAPVIVGNTTTRVNCQAIWTFCQVILGMTVGSASTLLMLRTIAVWNLSRFVVIPLVIGIIGHWAVLFLAMTAIQSHWSDANRACMVNAVHPVFLDMYYLYTMSFDCLVLVLTTVRLIMSPTRSSLWQLIFRQGIIYFLVAFIANALSAIFLLLDLNPMMNIIACIPAAVASSIVACRSFVSLSNFRQKDVYVHSAVLHPPIRTRNAGSSGYGTSSDDSRTEKKRKTGNSIAGIVFRSVTEGVNSMGESYGMEEFDATGTTGTLPVADVKPGYDLERNANGHVVVHTETMVHDHGDMNDI